MQLSQISLAITRLGGVPFNPAALFANGEQGAWYDPSDLTTLFQDSAGTTPVTAVEQAVGLVLDKSKFLALGSELVTTLPTPTIQDASGSSGQWNGTTQTISSSVITVDDSYPRFLFAITGVSAGKSYKVTISAIGTNLSRVKNPSLGGSGTVQSFAGGSISFIAVNVANNTLQIVGDSRTAFSATLVVSVRELPGNHAYQSTSASRPVLRQDGNGKYYLAFDGTDDSLLTNSVDFSSTDKMTVWAGIRKLSDALQGVVSELSATIAANNGAFLLTAPNSAAANYNWSSKGTTQVDNTVTTYTAPITNIVTGTADIAGSSNVIRVNGAQAGSVVTTQGTGNYGNYPLYIGRRNNATLPLNGNLYSLIIRGAQSTASQISATESWVNQKTGAY